MAEYVEVMKQKKRMCNSILCCKCDIFHLSGEDIVNCPQFISNNPSEAEKIIMSWAAEHPEPVYPTWLELAVQQGFKIEEGKQCTDEEQLLILLMASVNTPIPVDIAQKLGIEPKEVK